MKIGSLTPPWRVPTFINGNLTYSALSFFRGHTLVLCCPSVFTVQEAILLDTQMKNFNDRQVVVATLASTDVLITLPSMLLHCPEFHIPILTDPLQRLSHALGLSRQLPPHRCETLLFDRDGRLDFRLIHDVNLRGLSRVLEVTERHFTLDTDMQSTGSWDNASASLKNMETAATVQAAT